MFSFHRVVAIPFHHLGFSRYWSKRFWFHCLPASIANLLSACFSRSWVLDRKWSANSLNKTLLSASSILLYVCIQHERISQVGDGVKRRKLLEYTSMMLQRYTSICRVPLHFGLFHYSWRVMWYVSATLVTALNGSPCCNTRTVFNRSCFTTIVTTIFTLTFSLSWSHL